jgi:peptidoglycan/LPS O-acetylase OafA/YrhL
MLHVSFNVNRNVPVITEFLLRRATRIYPFYWICIIRYFTCS